jgi:hypothetical protein
MLYFRILNEDCLSEIKKYLTLDDILKLNFALIDENFALIDENFADILYILENLKMTNSRVVQPKLDKQ